MLLLLVGQPYVAPVASADLAGTGSLVFTAAADVGFVPLELASDATVVFTVAADATVATLVGLAGVLSLVFTASGDAQEPITPRGWSTRQPGAGAGRLSADSPGVSVRPSRGVPVTAGSGTGRSL